VRNGFLWKRGQNVSFASFVCTIVDGPMNNVGQQWSLVSQTQYDAGKYGPRLDGGRFGDFTGDTNSSYRPRSCQSIYRVAQKSKPLSTIIIKSY